MSIADKFRKMAEQVRSLDTSILYKTKIEVLMMPQCIAIGIDKHADKAESELEALAKAVEDAPKAIRDLEQYAKTRTSAADRAKPVPSRRRQIGGTA